MKLLWQTLREIFHRTWPEGLFFGFLIRVGLGAQWRSNVRRDSKIITQFEDRSRHRSEMLIVLAGYKPELWPYTLVRMAQFVPATMDVCIVSSGKYMDHLAEWAETHGWSYLSTNYNDVSLVQNAAIERHPDAKLIFKLDEDIFIGKNFFEQMLTGREQVIRDGRYNVGIIAPVINVNGYGYRKFLKTLGLEGEYLARFGELRQAADGIHVHYDGEAAKWLWQQSLPFDQTVERFGHEPFSYSACPHRFSIGVILMHRDFWIEMGRLPMSVKPGSLGGDEESICRHCVLSSKVMIVLHNVFAGHFAFGPQAAVMKEALPQLKPGLELPTSFSQPQL